MFPVCPNRQAINLKHMVRVLQAGEIENFMAYCPQYKNKLQKVVDRFEEVVKKIQKEFQAMNSELDMKEFVFAIKTQKFKGLLIALKKGMDLK